MVRSPRGIGLRLTGSGDRISVVAGGAADILRLRREMPGRKARVSSLGRLQSLARIAGITFEVRVGRRSLARLSSDSSGSWVARLLGMAPLDIRLRDCVAVALGRT